MKNFRFIMAIALALFAIAPSAFSQGSTGTLTGTVSGPDGVIPGATVTVTDTQTQKERTVLTSGEGSFSITQLEFGSYTVKITAQGFKTHTATDLKINAGQEYSLNTTLEIGSLQETVTVTAGADVINSSNASLANTISTKDVKELPINGRNPLALLNTMAGVNATSSSINGQRSTVTNYTRDGLNVQDNFIRLGGFVQDRPTVDDTGEFTAILQNAGAEFSSSQTVQLITPRGGSDFHGALYEFNRNSHFGANTFFGNFNNTPRPFLNRNQFGGTISGPAPLPRFGEGGPSLWRDKGFFFFNTEIYRQASQAAASATTLLPAARNGTFTYTATCTAVTCPPGITPGQQITVNSLTGAGLNLAGGNAAVFAAAGGATSVDPVVQARILSRLPDAGNGTAQGINFTQGINFNVAAPVIRDAQTGRFDVQFNDENAANFVYKRTFDDNARTDLAYSFNTQPYVTQGATTTLYIGAYNWTPSASFSNEVRGGYQFSNPFFLEGGVGQGFVFSNSQTQAGNTVAGLITNPEGSFRSQGRNTSYWNIQDNATYSRGNHSFRFGFNRDAYQIVALNFAATTPVFNFSSTANPNTPGLTTALFPGGISATDLGRINAQRYLLAGIIGGASVQANVVDIASGFQLGAPAIRDLRYSIYSGYAQDQWRLSPRFTLNLGVRYDLYTPLNNPAGVYLETRVADGQTATEAALNPNGVYQALGINSGNAGDFQKADKNNFGPTVSFAWSPQFGGALGSLFPGDGGTVFRGGYRISYNNNEYVRTPDNAYVQLVGLGSQVINAFQGGSAQLRSVLTPRPDLPGFTAVPGNFATPALPTLPITYTTANNNAAKQGLVWVFDPDIQAPLVHEWNIGIQRDIGMKSVIELRYVGSMSNEIWRSVDSNQVDIRNNGFLADFIRARENCRLQGATIAGPADPLLKCTSAAFNAGIPGSQVLTVFPNLPSGGLLTNATILGQIRDGVPADLAVTYIINNLATGVNFLANPNAFVANVTSNGGQYRYNALQAEIRRRYADGFSYQVNYTFQKTLADSTQDTQQSVDPYLDNLNQRLNYARPQYDRTHTINGNLNLELPFGRGHRWLSDGGVASKIFGGFQMTSIFNISSGAPISILDTRGTLNRAGRSALQPGTSSLTASQIKDLVGIFKTPNGVFFINPSVLQATTPAGVVVDLNQPLPAGVTPQQLTIRGASPLGVAPFPGQVFFRNPPGSTGNLPMNFINGPIYFNWNAGLFRNFGLGETRRLQLRAEVFNVLNNPQFNLGEGSGVFNVNSTTFGRVGSTFAARIVQFGARFDF
ncbi:MAG TPA: carboxypeptidase regulatory-like domain-containing protein [Pyrinomonadaceae bacterium]|nr:carboxypeptidase regulatory-like domain-containing protein [Pyrinomonadaceae bacterium]